MSSKPSKDAGWMLVIVGIILLYAAYLLSIANHFVFWVNQRALTFNRADSPVFFYFPAAAGFLIGTFFLIYGIRRILSVKPAKVSAMDGTAVGFRWSVLWGTVNTGLLLFFAWSAYAGLTPDNLRGTNPELVFCIVVFFAVALFAIATLQFAKVASFRKPQWGRYPLNWSRDPLQSLFITTCWSAGLVVGSVSRVVAMHFTVDKTAIWNVFAYSAIFAGLLVGQAIGYAAYRDRIES